MNPEALATVVQELRRETGRVQVREREGGGGAVSELKELFDIVTTHAHTSQREDDNSR